MEPTTENIIYTYAFLGVLLLTAAIGCLVINFSNILALQLPYIIAAVVLAGSSVLVLYKAIRMDKYRMRRA